MNAVIVRVARREDDAQIRAVLARNAMPGAMALAFAHEPSFFDAIEVEGYDPQVIVGERDGYVVGTGLMARRKVYLNGQPTEIGYLSSLRADTSIRGTTALVRGYRLLQRLHTAQPTIPFYLSTIMEENTVARDILTSERAGLPTYHEIGQYHTLAIPVIRRRKSTLPAGVRIVTGRAVGSEAIATFLQEIGPHRQCFPIYTAQDFTQSTGVLRGLALDDIFVAVAGDTIAGTLACWNQLPFRQHIVAGYHGIFAWIRPGINMVSSLFGCRLLPDHDSPVRCRLGACLAIRDDDPAILRALLRHVLCAEESRDYDYLFIGMAVNDPLLPTAGEPWHLTLRSRVYAVSWHDGGNAKCALDGRIPYLELGSL